MIHAGLVAHAWLNDAACPGGKDDLIRAGRYAIIEGDVAGGIVFFCDGELLHGAELNFLGGEERALNVNKTFVALIRALGAGVLLGIQMSPCPAAHFNLADNKVVEGVVDDGEHFLCIGCAEGVLTKVSKSNIFHISWNCGKFYKENLFFEHLPV